MDFWPRGIEKVKKFNIVVGDYFGGIPDPRYSLSNKLDLQGQNLSDIETRFDLLLKRTEILILTATAVSLKILCDLVDEDGFECLMKLTLDYLTELEYLINTTDGVPQSAFPSYTQYIPLPISDLDSWLKTPSIYVFDCSAAGMIVNAFVEVFNSIASTSSESSPRDCILLAACEAHETLPQSAEFPADVFTSCLTTPIKMALR
ncbi:hypothetical protein TEA_004285 [Camellia sinensis var. sinensis]|uniref:Raptor N-terminal CASPase-like domain-containing protein n=1 Tax=Camellia sinensis var. sinensis TaxID=542762 RepID=A0A4S4E5S9_CAMSN|nr:hypothetical protein TEA_004285 [Camellia sinensis var. sinensis]